MKTLITAGALSAMLLTGCRATGPAPVPVVGDDDCVHRITRVEVDDSFCQRGDGMYEWVPDDEGIEVDGKKKAKKTPSPKRSAAR